LKGKHNIYFRRDLVYSKAQTERQLSKAIDHVPENDEDKSLFETLRKLRLDISRQLAVPPYVIFHDSALKEMALIKPTTTEEFLQITGVGAAKAQRYSEVFLDCIRGEDIDLSHYIEKIQTPLMETTEIKKKKNKIDDKKLLIISLLKEGKLNSAEIAEKTGVSPPTVWAYKANFTMGKYENINDDNNASKHPSTDWEPGNQKKAFIQNKIRELGSVESINAYYSEDSKISKYAKRIVPQILSEISTKNEKPKPPKLHVQKVLDKGQKKKSNLSGSVKKIPWLLYGRKRNFKRRRPLLDKTGKLQKNG
jgi:ATP-dependent DNA helicase RecQ